MKLIVVMLVRDEWDILPVTIGHHLAMGADEVWVTDNGSTDGTAELLDRLASGDSRIRWRREDGPFDQAHLTTTLVHEAVADGADWVLPVDADELWWSTEGSLRPVLEETGAGGLRCEVVNFVQRHGVRRRHPAALLTMTRSAVPEGAPETARPLLESGAIGWVQMRYPPKLISRAAPGLYVHVGNHGVEGLPGQVVDTDRVVVLHAPLRARQELGQMAEHGRRSRAVNPDPEIGWHSKRWARLEDDGLLDEEWHRLSTRRGAIQVGGRRVPLVRDRRLADAARAQLGVRDRLLGPARARWASVAVWGTASAGW